MPRPKNENERVLHNVNFQLDLGKPHEYDIAQYLHEATITRKKTRVIREALALYIALQAGGVETLLEMFPRTQGKITDYHSKQRSKD